MTQPITLLTEYGILKIQKLRKSELVPGIHCRMYAVCIVCRMYLVNLPEKSSGTWKVGATVPKRIRGELLCIPGSTTPRQRSLKGLFVDPPPHRTGGR